MFISKKQKKKEKKKEKAEKDPRGSSGYLSNRDAYEVALKQIEMLKKQMNITD